MHLRTLLAECAKKLNQYGPDSREVDDFIRKNAHDREFVQLAELARTLKREVLARNAQREVWRSSQAAPAPQSSSESSQPSHQPGVKGSDPLHGGDPLC